MSIIRNHILAGASGNQGFEIGRSLRFNDGDSPYLNRTPSSAGNRTTWTWSGWVKRSNLGANQGLFSAGTSTSNFEYIRFDSDDTIRYTFYISGSVQSYQQTDAKFRDVSAWYHVLVYRSGTTAKIYINGVEQSLSNNTTSSSNGFFNATNDHNLGRREDSASQYFDGYMAEVNFVDGTALGPSDFGETDPVTGAWIPKKYSGTYGTNGFYLKFADNSGVTATTLGKDSSGNGNNWTPNNFSVTAGAGNDSLEDTPTNNWCTLNPLSRGVDNPAVSDGNLYLSSPSTDHTVTGTFGIPSSGKWYWEYSKTAGANLMSGIIHSPEAGLSNYLGGQSGGYSVYASNGNKYNAASASTYMATPATSTTITIAFDADNNKLYFGADGNWADGSGNTDQTFANAAVAYTVATGYTYFPAISFNGGNAFANFGQRPFDHTPPTGYKALNAANLPVPTVKNGTEYFSASLWTGNGTSQSIDVKDNLDNTWQPEWAWLKTRSVNYQHSVYDAVRGASQGRLATDQTLAEVDRGVNNPSFISNGITVRNTLNDNASGQTLVGWFWNAGDNSSKTFTVKVVSDSGNKYRFDDFGTSAVTLDLEEGSTYVFDQSDSSNSGHPLRFSTTSDGTHNSGSEYTTGVTTTGTPGSAGAKTTIVVAASAPTLYYYCSAHSGMGGQANTNDTAGASNFAGSTKSTVRANAEAGFSIVSYTGSGANATIGHGLGVAPSMVIVKNRDASTDWSVYAQPAIDQYGAAYAVFLQAQSAAGSYAGVFNSTAPTSTVFSVGTSSSTNSNTKDYIAYCFSNVNSYLKVGKYTGNGSTNGTFIYTGFRPAFVMTKRIDSTGSWYIFDSTRATFNEAEPYSLANAGNTEATDLGWDLLSNGFKHRTSYIEQNASSGIYMYMAFAETPFKYANAR